MTQAVKLAQLGSPGISTGFKNRIINGAMVIDQRNAGASITPSNAYTLDRWQLENTQTSKLTIQQNAGSVTPPAGFSNYLGITSTSSYSVVSSDYFVIRQMFEGFNTSDFNFGTANAKTVTLSFWVRSSLTGTFGGSLKNDGNTRSYPFSYTISAANTWEQKTITIAGDTTGTWPGATNGRSMTLSFSVGSGADNVGTAGSWQAANLISVTGATSVVGTNGATWYLTGVQLEVGTTATDFEYRDYGRELMMCQRYFYLHASTLSNRPIGNGFYYSSTGIATTVHFPTSMRSQPTIYQTTGTNYYNIYSGSDDPFNSFSLDFSSLSSSQIYTGSNVSGTLGRAGSVFTYDASAYLAFNAEL